MPFRFPEILFVLAYALIAPCVYTYFSRTGNVLDVRYRSQSRAVVRMGRRTVRGSVDEGRVAAGGKSGGVERCGTGGRTGGREKERESAREKEGERKREVGEQYLGDFALYLEMSFVGSISSTIRTLSLCPGVYRGVGSIRVYLCLQIDTRRTWVHPLPPFSLHFSLLSLLPVPPRVSPIYIPAVPRHSTMYE